MGKAKLEILGLTVTTLPWNFYHDEGYVTSISEHIRTLKQRYRYPIWEYETSEEVNKCSRRVLGRHMILSRGITIHNHIFYLRDQDETLNMAVRAHEETHALDWLDGGLDVLADRLFEEQDVISEKLGIVN